MNRRTFAIGLVCFLLGLVLGILAQPWALSRYVKSLHEEIDLLEKKKCDVGERTGRDQGGA